MNLGSPSPLSGRIGVNGLQADFRINSPAAFLVWIEHVRVPFVLFKS